MRPDGEKSPLPKGEGERRVSSRDEVSTETALRKAKEDYSSAADSIRPGDNCPTRISLTPALSPKERVDGSPQGVKVGRGQHSHGARARHAVDGSLVLLCFSLTSVTALEWKTIPAGRVAPLAVPTEG